MDELRYLEDYFMGLQKQGKPVVELYEKVRVVRVATHTAAKDITSHTAHHLINRSSNPRE